MSLNLKRPLVFLDIEATGLNVDSITPQAAIYLTIQIDLVGKIKNNCLFTKTAVSSKIQFTTQPNR